MLRALTACLISLSLFFFACIPNYVIEENSQYKRLLLNKNESIILEVADNSLEQYNGLSRRHNLCTHCGMAFEFSSPAIRRFVMRDMNFPLDIVWILGTEVAGFTTNLQPQSPPYEIYASPKEVNLVLELPAGTVDKYAFKIGQTINYDK